VLPSGLPKLTVTPKQNAAHRHPLNLYTPTFIFTALSCLVCVVAGEQAIVIPPLRTSLDVDKQPVAIGVSGSVAKVSSDHDRDVFRVAIDADLAGLQDNITPILRAELNKDDRCGERLAINQATLAPAAPASTLHASLHYEKWACIKAFHKDVAKRLAGGDATVDVRLTPEVREGDEVRLAAEIGAIQADGSIGELLRSPAFADALREKIAKALDKVKLEAAIPPALRSAAHIDEVRFADAGAGRLMLRVRATVAIPARDANALLERLASPGQPAAPAR
jgi:hypothetical protein